jgi:hypothetical protein
MYRRFHDRFGTAGVLIAVLALIAALGGSALAAGGLTKAQEKQVTKIAKKYAGKPGAPGAPGTNGTNGTNGTDGAPGPEGAAGKNGADGASVTGAAIAAGGTCGSAAGVKYTLGATSTSVCNGEQGQPWTPDNTLPSGATFTGAWSLYNEGNAEPPQVDLSFGVPLAAPLPASNVKYVTAATTECPGSAADPQAEEGFLCVYEESHTTFAGSYSPSIHNPASKIEVGGPGSGIFAAAPGAGRAGALLVNGSFAGIAYGTWAVTAP